MRESDIDLYDKIVSKDTNSLETLYDRYESLLYSFIYKITQDKQSSEEVLQDVFMKIWNQKAQFDSSKGKMSTWLITISRNLAIDYIRKRKTTPYEYDEERDNIKTDNVPESELITKEEALNRLKDV
ncbi:sigma-70 family RNA polymerase sigma factor [Mammaliicoccus sciuri]|nr:sigma-70 family RNA polymerase sigma factor [Mammaliicoccus sciuri]